MKKRRLKKSFRFFLLVIAIAGIDYFAYRYYCEKIYQSLYVEIDDSDIEYGTKISAQDLIIDHNGLITVIKDIDTMKTGGQMIKFLVVSGDVSREFAYGIYVEDNQPPQIDVDIYELIMETEDFNIEDHITVYDPVDGYLSYAHTAKKGYWTYELSEDDVGIQTINVTAVDIHGNTTDASRQFQYVTEADLSKRAANLGASFTYCIKVNRSSNTVTIYTVDENLYYVIPVKSMVCSTGSETPLGIYQTTETTRWLSLGGMTYGQYATRVTDTVLFHSVPYLSASPDTLEYEEYNKLGTSASYGHIWLTVIDAKWIIDNCQIGTPVEFYDDENDPGPLGKPVSLLIDEEDAKRGWDPTDPDPRNPWYQ